MCSLEVPQPNTAWWVLFETSIENIRHACAEINNIYSFDKLNIGSAKKIIEEAYTKKNINREFNLSYLETNTM